ncbi:POLR protein, partial [Campylorhamphus procurvoides]|nr:POLR protein [Campylorhamphus procurvoides]
VITTRLTKACLINPRQREFIKSTGCSKNLSLLQLLFYNVQKEHRQLRLVFVDIVKAFDAVNHQHILMGLK